MASENEPGDLGFLLIDELRIAGYGESDRSGCWVKLEILPEHLDAIRGHKGWQVQVSMRLVNDQGQPVAPDGVPVENPYLEGAGEAATREHAVEAPKRAGAMLQAMHRGGFFRAPAVHAVLGGREAYGRWVRSQPCVVPGCRTVPCEHFVRGERPRDFPVPLCTEHRSALDRGGLGALLPEGAQEHPKMWFSKRIMSVVEQWAHEALRGEFDVDSLSRLDSAEIRAWIGSHDLVNYLPAAFRDERAGAA